MKLSSRTSRRPPRGSVRWLPVAVCAAACFAVVAATMLLDNPAPDESAASAPEVEARVQALCSQCHGFPSPSSFPRYLWHAKVEEAFSFIIAANMDLNEWPSVETATKYFESHAPVSLELHDQPEAPPESAAIAFTPHNYEIAQLPRLPGISHANAVHLTDSEQPDCLLSDLRQSRIMLWRHDSRDLVVLGNVPHPAHAELVDLDRDGYQDILVADLGVVSAVDDKLGQIVWLRRDPGSESYQPVVLAKGLGRTADVQAADFDGDGDLDLVAAIFGFHQVGEIAYFENETTDYTQPKFTPSTLDPRPGAINVIVTHLNDDALPDFVALVSQEYEEVLAFFNQGDGEFRSELIFKEPDPSFGSTGIELVDLDQDGDLDVLLTNGDSLDLGFAVKPYHGIQWLENRGTFPYARHHLASLPGAHRAVAADLDADGDLDIAAAAFLPDVHFPQRKEMGLASLVWLEQTAPGEYALHRLETGTCDHATLDIADFDRDGDLDLVTGNYTFDGLAGEPQLPPMPGWITIWENQRR